MCRRSCLGTTSACGGCSSLRRCSLSHSALRWCALCRGPRLRRHPSLCRCASLHGSADLTAPRLRRLHLPCALCGLRILHRHSMSRVLVIKQVGDVHHILVSVANRRHWHVVSHSHPLIYHRGVLFRVTVSCTCALCFDRLLVRWSICSRHWLLSILLRTIRLPICMGLLFSLLQLVHMTSSRVRPHHSARGSSCRGLARGDIALIRRKVA